MSDPLYEDDQCIYCWGDPRLDKRCVPCVLILKPESINVRTESDTVAWPIHALLRVAYDPVHAVDIESIAGDSAEILTDLASGLAADHAPDPAVLFEIDDPEGVYPDGFKIHIAFRNEYYAKVAEKRVKELLSRVMEQCHIAIRPRPGTILSAPVVIGLPMPSGNLAVHFESGGWYGQYPYTQQGIDPNRVPASLRDEGTTVWFVYDHREQLMDIRPRIAE